MDRPLRTRVLVPPLRAAAGAAGLIALAACGGAPVRESAPTPASGERAPSPAAGAMMPPGSEPTILLREAAGARVYTPAAAPADARLAAELSALFAGVEQVERAYLAEVREGSEGPPVLTVCIAARAPVSDEVVREMGRAFAATHGTAGVLDVLELGAAQERVLARSVPPFYGTPLPSKETEP